MENNLVDDMEEDYFSIDNILQGLRLGKYREQLSTELAYSFSGKITDFNVWSRALGHQDMIAWTNCQAANLNPDLGEIISHLFTLSFLISHFSFLVQLTGRHRPGSSQVYLRFRIVWRRSVTGGHRDGSSSRTRPSSTAASTPATCSTPTWASATPGRRTTS